MSSIQKCCGFSSLKFTEGTARDWPNKIGPAGIAQDRPGFNSLKGFDTTRVQSRAILVAPEFEDDLEFPSKNLWWVPSDSLWMTTENLLTSLCINNAHPTEHEELCSALPPENLQHALLKFERHDQACSSGEDHHVGSSLWVGW